jgi:hypothetical protein
MEVIEQTSDELMEPVNELQMIVPQDKLTEVEFREWIEDVENKMKAYAGSVDINCAKRGMKELNEMLPITNTFTPGLYTRQIFMPAGTFVISRIHMHEHPFIISQGTVSVYDGDKVNTYTAPYQGITKPGTKRILYNHTDVIWTTFHVTDKHNIEDLEEVGVVVCDCFSEYNKLVNKEITL